MRAIERKVTADENGLVAVNGGALISNKEVRVIVLLDEETDEISEEEWLKFASQSGAFDFLNDEPDIYTINDGVPYVRPHIDK